MVDTPKEQVMLNTACMAEFVYPDEPTTAVELNSRNIKQDILNKATASLEPIFRNILVVILEAQSQHYIKPKPEEVKE